MRKYRKFFPQTLITVIVGVFVFSCYASALPPAERVYDFKNSQFTAPPAQGFQTSSSQLLLSGHKPHHNGYDMIFRQGEAQSIEGKFQYGDFRKGMENETIRIYVWSFPDAHPQWKFLSQMNTNDDGRIKYNIPASRRLAPGLHLVKLYVVADGTQANMYIQVLNKTENFVVFDIDGTLTTSDTEMTQEYLNELWDGTYVAKAKTHALDVVTWFADRNYNIIYLTAQPYWLSEKSQTWLREKGFPVGILHTYEGAGILTAEKDIVDYKSKYLQSVIPKGVQIGYAYGNNAGDFKSYRAAGVPANRIFQIVQ